MHISTFLGSFPVSTLFIPVLAMVCFPLIARKARKIAINQAQVNSSRWQGMIAILYWVFCWTFMCVSASQIWHSQKEWIQFAARMRADGTVPYFEAGGFTHAQALHYHLLSHQSLERWQALHYQILSGNVWLAIILLIAPVIAYWDDRFHNNRLRRGHPSGPTVMPA